MGIRARHALKHYLVLVAGNVNLALLKQCLGQAVMLLHQTHHRMRTGLVLGLLW